MKRLANLAGENPTGIEVILPAPSDKNIKTRAFASRAFKKLLRHYPDLKTHSLNVDPWGEHQVPKIWFDIHVEASVQEEAERFVNEEIWAKCPWNK